MKAYLLLSFGSMATASVLPSLPAKIVLGALVLVVALTQAVRSAPFGYQDKDGFHPVTGNEYGHGQPVGLAMN